MDPGVAWLADATDPAVRALARRDLLDEPVPAAVTLQSPLVQGLLTDPPPGNPYAKWAGAHWRLVSLVELGVPAHDPAATRIADTVLTFWAKPERLANTPIVTGRARVHASMEGNAVAAACRLGLSGDDRVAALVERLLACQWPDGGWNCDRHADARVSSFHESLPALWGLAEYSTATGDPTVRAAADRAAERLLRNGVVFATSTDRPAHPTFAVPHYPPYWHFDVLQALLVLTRSGHGQDPRTRRARKLLAERRRSDGTWRAARRWWRPPDAGGGTGAAEAVDWGDAAHQMVTLNALRVGAGVTQRVSAAR